MDLSIIIVNWNTAQFVQKCLESIIRQTDKIQYEIIVVDNASYDECNNIIKNEFNYDNIKFIQSEQNLGFARANNLAFQYAKGEILLFLNPDTEILDNAINKLYDQLKKLPVSGIIGCKLLNSDFTLQTTCVQTFPTIINQMFNLEILRRMFKIGGMKALSTQSKAPIEVEVIVGACMMMPKFVFEKIGLFSSEYFMYAEDIDLCYKVRKQRFKVYYYNRASIVHHDGGSTKSNPQNFNSMVLMRQSVHQFVQKSRGIFYSEKMRFGIMIVALVRIGFMSVFRFMKIKKQKLNSSSLKWKKIFRWSVGLERHLDYSSLDYRKIVCSNSESK